MTIEEQLLKEQDHNQLLRNQQLILKQRIAELGDNLAREKASAQSNWDLWRKAANDSSKSTKTNQRLKKINRRLVEQIADQVEQIKALEHIVEKLKKVELPEEKPNE